MGFLFHEHNFEVKKFLHTLPTLLHNTRIHDNLVKCIACNIHFLEAILENTSFHRTPPVAASEKILINTQIKYSFEEEV